MPVRQVIGKLKQNARFHAALVVGLHVHFQRKSVHSREIRTEIRLRKQIGIVA